MMKPFTTIESVAAYLPATNIDTDIIFPARYLLLLDRDGLGQYLFRDRRFEGDGKPVPDFVLNRQPFTDAKVLIAGSGFGCGSSREQAVWALTGHGIHCVIAPSFGEIFASNSLKNGLLPLTLSEELTTELGVRAEAGAIFTVDLQNRVLKVDGETVTPIDIPEGQRQALLNGWDETDILLKEEGESIAAFEQKHRASQPWLFLETRL
jgi:3-isopropylmalate/(R)-2-methylmalate dehydratase small subunit